MSEPLLEFRGVSKRFSRRADRRTRDAIADALRELRGLPPRDELREGEFWALRDIDLQVGPGESVGLIGHNGAGKSTLMQLAAGSLMPTAGSIVTRTREICRIDAAGVVSPIETGRENILMQLALHRVPRVETEAEVAAIAAIAGLDDRLDQEVGTYSAGMRGRLGFAIFARLRPELLLVDEGIGGGDRRFRERFRGFLDEYLADGGAMLFAMHDTNAIMTLCDRGIVLDEGRVLATGDAATAIDAYNELADRKGLPPMPKPRHGRRARTEPVAPVPGPGSGVTVAVALSPVGDAPPRTGGPVELVVTVTAERAVENVACLVEIGRGELFPLARVRRRLPGLRAGTTTLRCTIESWPLVAGRGEVQAGIIDPVGRRPIARSELLAIEVVDPEGTFTERDAIVRIGAAWVEAVPDAAKA